MNTRNSITLADAMASEVESKVASLREEVRKLALRQLERSYDSVSRTHIYFSLKVGKFGIRGTGPFMDVAHKMFEDALDLTVNQASSQELSHWLTQLQTNSHAEPTTVTQNTITSVGLVTSTESRDQLKSAAAKQNKSATELALDMLYTGFDALEVEADTVASGEVRDQIKSCYPAERREQWVLRMPNTQRARIAFFAKRLGLTVPEVCNYILLAALGLTVSHRKLSAAGDQR